MTCPHGHSAGAYVLGALSPAERSAFQAHLAECDTCAAAVAALAPMPGLLGRVDPTTLEPVAHEPESERLPQLLTAATDQRRRQRRARRWQLTCASLGAAVVAAAGAAIWTAPGDGTPELEAQAPATMMAMTPVVVSLPVTAQVGVVEAQGGTEVWMSCQYGGEPHDPRPYWLVAYGHDGTSEQVGSWTVAPGDEIDLTGLTRYSYEELARVELQGSDGAPLLTYTFS
jgi:anti-sigma factor RsiW